MSKFEQLVEDYALEPVPQHATYGGWRIGFVLGGIGIALPALLSGAEVAVALGYEASLQAFFLAGILVCALATVTGLVGMKSRLSTYMILKFSFGEHGAKLVNLSFALAQFGWFGVNAYFFGTSAEQLSSEVLGLNIPSPVYVGLGGILMTAATIFGFKALDRLALFVFPMMIALLAAMMVQTFGTTTYSALDALTPTQDLSFAQAITVLVGGIIVGVLLVPDLTRYARKPKDVVIATVMALLFIEVLVHVAAAGPALMFDEMDPLALMLGLGLGGFALGFLIIASLSTNMVNLYGSGLALTASFPKTPEWLFVIIAGVVGTGLALIDVADYFLNFLIWQSVIFSSVLGIYVVDFFFVRKGDYRIELLSSLPAISWAAIAAWVCGAAIASLTYIGVFRATGASTIDGAIISGALYWLLARNKGKALS